MPEILIKKQKVVIENQTVNVSNEQYIGYKIKELRQNAGMTQEDLAEKLGLVRSSVANIETARHRFNIEILAQICLIFNVKSSDILPF